MTEADVLAALPAWHDFWFMVGGAAATLAGLVFVAITFRPDILRAHDASYLARASFFHFLTLLSVAALALVPWTSAPALGFAVVALGAVSIAQSVFAVRRLRAVGRAGVLPGRLLARRVGLPSLARVVAILAGVEIFRGDERGFAILALSAAILAITASASVWELVVAFER